MTTGLQLSCTAVARARRERFAIQSLVGRGVRSVGARPPGPSGSCGDFAGIAQSEFRRKEEDATSSVAQWAKDQADDLCQSATSMD